MNDVISIRDKRFRRFVGQSQISEAVKKVADGINRDLVDTFPVFLVVLNGSFMFAADLLKEVVIPCEVSFIKLASYTGTESSGKIKELIGLNAELKGRTVVIVEDIVDSGATIKELWAILNSKEVKQIKTATALMKPTAYKEEIKIDYIGVEIGNEFVVGYGLDYDGLGRNLKEIYVLV